MNILISNQPWFTPVGASKDAKPKMGLRAGCRWPYIRPIHRNYFPFPFNLAYADAYLKQKGMQSVFRDSILHLDEYTYFFNLAREFDYVVMETAMASKDNDYYIAKEVSKYSKVILVGPLATSNAELIDQPEVYAVLRGEYERSLYACLTSGKGGVYEFDEWENIDNAPFPTRDESIYDYKMARHKLALNMWGSRGCPFSCTFCYSQKFQKNKRYRGHSPERIQAEVQDAVKRFPKLRYIYFDDDTFNIGNARIKGIARVMKEIGLPWGAMCRIDTCDVSTWQAMKDGGCVEVKVGFESGSQRILDEVINKSLDLEKAKETLRAIRSMGIRVHGTFMRGFEGETPEERSMTAQLISELPCNSHQLSDLRKQ